MLRAASAVLALAFLFGAHTHAAVGATPFTASDAAASLGQTSWSPDGRRISYVDEFLHYSLSVVAPDGSAQRSVHELVLDPAQWSPDGRRIAWTSYRKIRVADVGAEIVREWPLSAGPYNDGPWLHWAPGGDRVVYQERGTYYSSGPSIIVSAWDGSARRDLGAGEYPEWSPDGQEIAFLAIYPNPLGIHAIRPDGTQRRLVVGTSAQTSPRWGPEGDRIAYREYYGTVFVVGRDGLGRRSLGTARGDQLSWSPDGAWLAVGGDLIEVDGPGRVHFDMDSWVAPRWSPSGQEILYSRSGQLFVGSTLGFERSLAAGIGADWSPDGRQISFLRAPYGAPMPFDHCFARVHVIGVDGAGERPVSTCRVVGGDRRDVIAGTSGPDDVFARGGRDLVSGGAGVDRIFGGPGGDRLFGAAGEDVLLGGTGNDRLAAWDGERDHVRCGPGHDVANVDAVDLVASDCEVVRRRSA